MHRLLIILLALTACTQPGTPWGSPFGTRADLVSYSERRGQVEVFVKSNHAALISQIASGGGPDLDDAMGLAGIPVADRPARLIQLRADLRLYERAPAALVTALMLYAG